MMLLIFQSDDICLWIGCEMNSENNDLFFRYCGALK